MKRRRQRCHTARCGPLFCHGSSVGGEYAAASIPINLFPVLRTWGCVIGTPHVLKRSGRRRARCTFLSYFK